MPEAHIIARTQGLPATVDSLVGDLSRLGVLPGDLLMVHTSLSSLGWVVGGADAVIRALEQAVGPDGTLMMPAHSNGLSDPAGWANPAVPEGWWPVIRDHMPAFDPATTPTRALGQVAELFRTRPGVRRSAHPHFSFTAKGPLAEMLLNPHPLDFPMGEESPLARLYDRNGRVLLLGVGHDSNSTLHLAEYRAPWTGKETVPARAPMQTGFGREWVTWFDLSLDADDFPDLGAAFEHETAAVRIGRVGAATARLMPARALVDFAMGWLMRHRT